MEDGHVVIAGNLTKTKVLGILIGNMSVARNGCLNVIFVRIEHIAVEIY